MKRKSALLSVLLLLTILLSGCFVENADELYSLPIQSNEYTNLQEAIDSVMTSDMAYSAPVSGSNQQPVQFADLDGDGEEEAAVFLSDTGESPLKIYIFDPEGEEYRNTAVIEGSGSSFSSVQYVQMDEIPGLEIVVGRQISEEVQQALAVYGLHEGHIVELVNCNYSEYTLADLTDNGLSDLFVLRFDAEERKGVAELYAYSDGLLEREPEVSMMMNVDSIKRIISGKIEGNLTAVFVASIYDSTNVVTDVFAVRDGVFCNITDSADDSLSATTVRNYFVYATDIDLDGVIELPEPTEFPVYSVQETAEDTDIYRYIRWYSLDENGRHTYKMTTFHNYSGGWYVELEDEWVDRMTVYRSAPTDGVLGFVFAEWDGGDTEPKPLFHIYAFTGDDRNELANAGNRFSLGEKGETAYSAAIGAAGTAKGVTEETLRSAFHYIRVDWNTGEM